ncbi:protein kinase [Acidobacteriota bacterium]
MKCPKCNADNPDTKQFCGDCGTQLSSLPVTKTLQTPLASPGKTIAGKYKILSELGRGGMGVVYKAKDTRLKRTVALKFLPAELTKDKEAKERFIQEAQAAAALNHPQICTIYEVDETENQTFIAMEYIEGQSLKDKLKEEPLDIDEAKDIAIQVAEGLMEAHEKGIVHRDIKPANIMLTKKGQAKITDFGLAKLSWGVDLTKTSTIMGTAAYMSPEQAKGEEVDHRTDIWSLGAMLHEMLSGERPFYKSQEQALIYAILNDKPTPLSLIRSDIPSHIEQVVEKALSKKARERYQNIQELIQDLELSITFPKAEKSIVVLPFEDMSPNRDNEYFSDGLTEEIISDLSQIHDLLVISRSSAMTFKGTKKKINEIANDVKVQYVLEGSVRKAGNNLRITAQLIEAVNDVHLWAEKYSGTLDDVFDIQEKVSRSIVDALKLKLNPEEDKKIAERPIEDVRAYECYVKARQGIHLGTEVSFKHAIQLLESGLEIIGENADLYGGMATAYLWAYENGFKHDEETLQKALEYAEKAKKLHPNTHHYPHIFGWIERIRGSNIKAIKHVKRALTILPNDPESLFFMSHQLSVYAGRSDLAKPYMKKLMEVDPMTPINYLSPGYFHLMRGELDLSIAAIRKSVTLFPEVRFMKLHLSRVLSFNGQLEEAFKFVDQLIIEDSQDLIAIMSLLFKYVHQGNKAKALQILTDDLKKMYWTDSEGRWWMAEDYSLLDEKEEALKWLEHAVNRGFINYPWLAEKDRFLENIRSEPRFKKIMERVKQEWANFEV